MIIGCIEFNKLIELKILLKLYLDYEFIFKDNCDAFFLYKNYETLIFGFISSS
jgi:hypothetical protein